MFPCGGGRCPLHSGESVEVMIVTSFEVFDIKLNQHLFILVITRNPQFVFTKSICQCGTASQDTQVENCLLGPTVVHWVKDLVLSLQQLWSLPRHRLDPWLNAVS